ncbi:GDPD5 protein, partial [Pomatorhinus ruficollis]|nr:GDPD5 protein [Pomatorhinus ruficollis]
YDYSWFLFLFCVFLFTLVWLYFAIIILNDFHNFNEFIFRERKLWLDWSLVLLIATAVLISYSSVLLLLALCLQLCGQPLKLHWVHKVRDWDCREMMSALAALTPSEAGTSLLWLCMAAVTPLSGCVSPLSWAAAQNQLPPKPALVGHRGAPMLAPENTLMSLHKAVECDVQVFETDVMVSADGVPFLMHDEELTRTTNVQTVFPERAALNSTAFNWTDLQQLDAGSWFLERRPFPTVQSLSPDDRKEAAEQRIPSLEQALEAAKQSNISIMFDLRPENHSDYQNFVNVTLGVILQSGIPLQQVSWSP